MVQRTPFDLPTVEAHILVVDDDVAIRDLINEYLTENNFKVSVAETGADMDRVLFFEYNDGERLTLPNDNDGLSDAVQYNDVGLVIFDPIVSVLPDNVDAEKGQILRRALEPINRIAADTRCAFLGIAHFNKRSEGDMGLLLSGSLVWSQVARATLGLIADPDNENGFFFLNGKKLEQVPGGFEAFDNLILEEMRLFYK
jgi:hypothetical protein